MYACEKKRYRQESWLSQRRGEIGAMMARRKRRRSRQRGEKNLDTELRGRETVDFSVVFLKMRQKSVLKNQNIFTIVPHPLSAEMIWQTDIGILMK